MQKKTCKGRKPRSVTFEGLLQNVKCKISLKIMFKQCVVLNKKGFSTFLVYTSKQENQSVCIAKSLLSGVCRPHAGREKA